MCQSTSRRISSSRTPFAGADPTSFDQPIQVLGEALTFAAANDGFNLVDALLDAGFRSMPPRVAVDDEWNATPATGADVYGDDSAERVAISALLA